jgi:hypothetical protein
LSFIDCKVTTDIDIIQREFFLELTESTSLQRKDLAVDRHFAANQKGTELSNLLWHNKTITNNIKTNQLDVSPFGTDLSGSWEIIVNNEFKQQFDRYLLLLGQSLFV